MKITQKSLSFNSNSLQPELVFDLYTEIPEYELYLPLSGVLLSGDGKAVTKLYESKRENKESLFRAVDNEKYGSYYRNPNLLNIQLSGTLDRTAIQYIEDVRARNSMKNVVLRCKILVNHLISTDEMLRLLSYGSSGYQDLPLFKSKTEEIFVEFEITQSDWIQKFSTPLGIGSYFLVELTKPKLELIKEKLKAVGDSSAEQEIFRIYERLQEAVLKMEKNLQMAEWDLVIRFAREFFEILKFDGNTNSTKVFLEKIYTVRNGTNVGFDELFSSIKSLFTFTSKFIHEIDRAGSLQVKPKAFSEDAYLIYTFCISILNFMANKI